MVMALRPDHLQYVSDLISGLMALMNSNISVPINIGNPVEYTILELVTEVQKLCTGVENDEYVNIVYLDLPVINNDPRKRQPCIDIARNLLNWTPKITLQEGLYLTIENFKNQIKNKNQLVPDSN